VSRVDDPAHHRWLAQQTQALIDFYRGSADPDGGFSWLDDQGKPAPDEPTHLWLTARMAHCFAVAHLLDIPGTLQLASHGIAALSDHGCLSDAVHDGWFASVRARDPIDDTKQAYGHAFVLLAAASAVQAGVAGADGLLRRATAVIDRWFWREADQLCVDTYSRDWQGPDPYRCANTNMHLAEAYLAAAEATGENWYAQRAEAIARRIIAEFTAANGWRLPVHFDQHWRAQLDYHADRPGEHFRPYGTTVGHWLEWIRLLVQLRARTGAGWLLPAATRLFDQAVRDGWDRQRGGFVYTVDWAGRAVLTDRMHWVVTEAIGAAVALYRVTGDARYDHWYATFWEYARTRLIDQDRGSWIHQLDRNHRSVSHPWHGKPDLYHTLQATLFARIETGSGLAAAAALHIPS
jgi:sulfoquinovose isomerase